MRLHGCATRGFRAFAGTFSECVTQGQSGGPTVPSRILCHRFGLFCLLCGGMMMTEVRASDAELVQWGLAGDREAFGRVVERYQSLICALAYSATGSLSRSEDLAQETFLIAWKQLRQLREPDKLRSWLCSIARSVIRSEEH